LRTATKKVQPEPQSERYDTEPRPVVNGCSTERRTSRSAIRTQLGFFQKPAVSAWLSQPYMEEPQASHVGAVVADVSIMNGARHALASWLWRAD
jgi:hypothetical protein